jgi:hypothetical protein
VKQSFDFGELVSSELNVEDSRAEIATSSRKLSGLLAMTTFFCRSLYFPLTLAACSLILLFKTNHAESTNKMGHTLCSEQSLQLLIASNNYYPCVLCD